MKAQLQHYHSATFQDSGGALPSNVLIKDYPELGCLIICKDSLYFFKSLHEATDYCTLKVFPKKKKKFSFLIIYCIETITAILIVSEHGNGDT